MKYKYLVDVDYYHNGSGYTRTETFECAASDTIETAMNWYENYVRQNDALFDSEKEWIHIKVRVYHCDDDPMVDEPVDESECCP